MLGFAFASPLLYLFAVHGSGHVPAPHFRYRYVYVYLSYQFSSVRRSGSPLGHTKGAVATQKVHCRIWPELATSGYYFLAGGPPQRTLYSLI